MQTQILRRKLKNTGTVQTVTAMARISSHLFNIVFRVTISARKNKGNYAYPSGLNVLEVRLTVNIRK